MTAEALARILTGELLRQRDNPYPSNIGYVDDDDLKEVIVDGRVDMIALAAVALASITNAS